MLSRTWVRVSVAPAAAFGVLRRGRRGAHGGFQIERADTSVRRKAGAQRTQRCLSVS
jgi:hypothetical protein